MIEVTRRESLEWFAASVGISAYLANASVASGQSTSTEDWPMFQYDSRNSGQTPSTGPKEEVGSAWETTLERGANGSPAIIDDAVILGNGSGKIYAISKNDGTQIWQTTPGSSYELSFPSISPTPAVSGDKVIVEGRGQDPLNNLYALDKNSGEQQWEFVTNYPAIRPPTISGGEVYVGGSAESGGNIFSISIENGNQQWEYETASGILSAPSVNDDGVFVTTATPAVHAISSDDGSEIWSHELKQRSGETERVNISASGDTVYVTIETRLIAFNSATGEERWQVELGRNAHIVGPAAVTNNLVIVGGLDNYVYAIKSIDGEKMWEFQMNSFATPPVIADETIYIGSADESAVYALSLDGEQRWRYEIDDGQINEPIPVANGEAYVSPGNKLIKLTEEKNIDQSINPTQETATTQETTITPPTPVGEESSVNTPANSPTEGFQKFLIRLGEEIFSPQALLIQGAAILAAIIYLTWPNKDGEDT